MFVPATVAMLILFWYDCKRSFTPYL